MSDKDDEDDEELWVEKRGSGLTTEEIMRALTKHCSAEMAGVVAKTNSSRNKKRENELMLSAFEDGMRTMQMHLVAMGIIVVKKGE
jgi:hypothetical protein